MGLLLVLGLLAAPPAPFTEALAGLTGSGFHVNTRLDPTGFEAMPGCPAAAMSRGREQVCAGLSEVWRTSIVADEKAGGEHVVQELWVFAYESSAAAASAAGGFDDLTFDKHPYTRWSSGRFLYVLEGGFGFPPRASGWRLARRGPGPDGAEARPALIRPQRFTFASTLRWACWTSPSTTISRVRVSHPAWTGTKRRLVPSRSTPVTALFGATSKRRIFESTRPQPTAPGEQAS
ncbi:MAG: hypothetical protein R3F60_06465 [bacterium]